MQLPRSPHPWNVDRSQAVAIQRRLACRVRERKTGGALHLVAGLDVAFAADGARCIAGAVVWHVRDRAVIEERVAARGVRFPYVPGLLSFREIPALLAVLRKLRHVPDALLCDGHGRAHPRRFGLACHLGVCTGVVSVGVAKNRLVGEHAPVGKLRGARVPLRVRGAHGDEIVGSVLRTRDGVRPVYVSVGHRIDLVTAERLVLACGAGYRLPEPTRLADHLVAKLKRERF
ncbi:MAG: endonuclease V [Candidatus Krumholzibacteriia bacterium]